MSKMIEVTKPAAPIHAQIVGLARAVDAHIDGGVKINQRIMDLILAVDLRDPKQVESVCDDVKATIESDAYANRIASMIRNARRVAFGGTKGRGKNQVSVPGKGIKALDAAMDGATGLNALEKQIRDALPKALKAPTPSATSATSAQKADKAAKAEPAKTAEPAVPVSKKDAFLAAVSILRQVENYLSPGADARMIGGVEAIIRELQMYTKAA